MSDAEYAALAAVMSDEAARRTLADIDRTLAHWHHGLAPQRLAAVDGVVTLVRAGMAPETAVSIVAQTPPRVTVRVWTDALASLTSGDETS